jgi:hypothetical protein
VTASLAVSRLSAVGGDRGAIASRLIQPATVGEPQPDEDTIV